MVITVRPASVLTIISGRKAFILILNLQRESTCCTQTGGGFHSGWRGGGLKAEGSTTHSTGNRNYTSALILVENVLRNLACMYICGGSCLFSFGSLVFSHRFDFGAVVAGVAGSLEKYGGKLLIVPHSWTGAQRNGSNDAAEEAQNLFVVFWDLWQRSEVTHSPISSSSSSASLLIIVGLDTEERMFGLLWTVPHRSSWTVWVLFLRVEWSPGRRGLLIVLPPPLSPYLTWLDQCPGWDEALVQGKARDVLVVLSAVKDPTDYHVFNPDQQIVPSATITWAPNADDVKQESGFHDGRRGTPWSLESLPRHRVTSPRIRPKKTQFHIKTTASSQPWGRHWEASAWLRPSVLRLTQSSADRCLAQSWTESFSWEKCPVPMLRDWLSRQKLILSILHVNLCPFASGGKKKTKTVPFRKFIIKAWRSMIMAFVLVFVIFAKATVVEFAQIYLYTRAVSGV